MLAALEYGLVDQSFFDDLLPEEKILADHHILNKLIQADNEAMTKQTKQKDDESKGIVRRFGVEEALARQKEGQF